MGFVSYPADVPPRLGLIVSERLVANAARAGFEHGTDDGEQRALTGPVWALQERQSAGLEGRGHLAKRQCGTKSSCHAAHIDARNLHRGQGDHCSHVLARAEKSASRGKRRDTSVFRPSSLWVTWC